jgi:putative transposase
VKRYMKGKSAINIARTYISRKVNFIWQQFWVRGYYVRNVGLDEEVIRSTLGCKSKKNSGLSK